MKLLIGCDAKTDTAALVADLQRAGVGGSGHAVVLSVADLLPPPEGTPIPDLPAVRRARERVARELEAARAVAEAAAARLRAPFPGWTIDAEAQADSPAWALVRRAAEWAPDLIVVGSHNHSTLGRMLLGSVSQSVLAHANCSVRIVRPPANPAGTAPRLLIGADGSAEGGAAVERLGERSWPPAVEVRVITALDATLASMLEITDPDQDESVAAARIAEQAAQPLRTAGLTTSTAVIDGHPTWVLLAEAERWQADCIFVGARGLRGIQRILLGGVSAAVAARAHCSVEVVRS